MGLRTAITLLIVQSLLISICPVFDACNAYA